jgi:hypothetical protein
MIPLINHDSRARKNSEVVIKFTQMDVYHRFQLVIRIS